MLRLVLLALIIFSRVIQCKVNVTLYYDVYDKSNLPLMSTMMETLNDQNSRLELVPVADFQADVSNSLKMTTICRLLDEELNTFWKLHKCLIMNENLDEFTKLQLAYCTIDEFVNRTFTTHGLSVCVQNTDLFTEIIECFAKCNSSLPFDTKYNYLSLIGRLPRITFDQLSLESYRHLFINNFRKMFDIYQHTSESYISFNQIVILFISAMVVLCILFELVISYVSYN